MWRKLSMQLVSKIFNLCGPDPPTSQTAEQTDGQTDDMQSQNLKTSETIEISANQSA